MRGYFWLLVSFPVIILIGILSFSYKKPVNLLDSGLFRYYEFSDNSNGGKSVSKITQKNSSILLETVLKEGIEFPFTGIQFDTKKSRFIDLENYSIDMKLEVNHDFRLSLRIGQFIDGYSDTLTPLSLLILSKSFGLTKGENHITFNVNDITEIQDWWFQFNPKMINKIQTTTYNKVKTVWLYVENSTPYNLPLEIKIKEISFHYLFLPLIYKFSIFAISYYLILLLVIWKVKKVKYILMPIELSKIGDKIPETQNKILSFIGSNYINPELKLEDVAGEIGISQDQVAELLRKHCGFTFRQYLNQVRLEEAKRLIRNSNLQIAEIAFNVGYNNIQHFNRVFKEYTSFTPTGFRELK